MLIPRFALAASQSGQALTTALVTIALPLLHIDSPPLLEKIPIYPDKIEFSRTKPMQIFINGEPTPVADQLSMAQLIEQLELTEQRLAVEVNEELVPRSRFADHRLREDDKVEIIHAVGGG